MDYSSGFGLPFGSLRKLFAMVNLVRSRPTFTATFARARIVHSLKSNTFTIATKAVTSICWTWLWARPQSEAVKLRLAKLRFTTGHPKGLTANICKAWPKKRSALCSKGATLPANRQQFGSWPITYRLRNIRLCFLQSLANPLWRTGLAIGHKKCRNLESAFMTDLGILARWFRKSMDGVLIANTKILCETLTLGKTSKAFAL